MTSYTAAELIAAAKAYMAAESAIMARRPDRMPRSAWREANPVGLPHQFNVRDISMKTKPERVLWFDLTGNPYDLHVIAIGKASARFVGRIDLRAADADQQLARFERV